MKIIMIAVCSVNGKLTKGEDFDIYQWTSLEDQKFFFSFIERSKLIVMGSGTYRTIRSRIKVQGEKLRVVMTHSIGVYKSEQINGVLEFSAESPCDLTSRLSKKYKQMLLVGGSKVYSSFVKEGLVDEIYLSVEPLIFGSGKNLFASDEFEAKLKLLSCKKLNKNGTMLLHYKVIK